MGCFYTESETQDKHTRKRTSESQEEAIPAKTSKQSSSIEMYQTYLKGVYNVKQLPVDEKYPIDCVKHFVNLTLTDSRKRVTKREDMRFRSRIMRGNIGSIRKEKVTMEQVAAKQDDSYPNLVLVKGAPGVGKTTFSWELCRRWSAGKLLSDYSLVVLLRLRDKRVQEARSLSDIFQCRDAVLSSNIAEEQRQVQGKGVLFILEGLDELPPSLREDKNSIFMDLITGRLLPACTVMVTTRPWAVKDLPDTCSSRIDQHIQILGFTKEQINEYVDHMIKDGVPEGLRTYVSANPHISSAMYNPLHARIVVEVYRECSEENESIFPNTTTELYTAYSTIIIHRYLTDHPADQQWDGDLNALPPSIEPQFNTLCRVAYKGITKEKQQLVFSKADIPDGNATLGFMNSVQPLHRTVTRATSPSYNFLHFTLQEYLAAVYIWKNHTSQQHMILFETKRKNGTYKMILIFLAGLTKFEDEYTRCVLPVPIPKASPLPEVSYSEADHVLWLYESQNVNLFHDNSISTVLIHPNESPQYYFALGYCIASIKSFLKLIRLRLTQSSVNWEMLVAGAMKVSLSTAKLKCLMFYGLDLGDPEVLTMLFNKLFKHISVDLEHFTLSVEESSTVTRLPDSLMNVLCSSPSLKQVELGQLRPPIDQENMVTLFKILGTKPCLEILNFELGATYDLEILSDLIVSSSSLKTLTLTTHVTCTYNTDCSPLTFRFNIHKLKEHCELRYMERDLFCYFLHTRRSRCDTVGFFKLQTLTHEAVSKISSVVKHFPHSLEVLNLGQNGLNSKGIYELASSVAGSSLKELQFPIVRDPKFKRDTNELQVMDGTINALTSIQTLHVTNCSKYLCILLSTLEHHTSIRDLVVEDAVIERQEAELFASLLRNNQSLQAVKLHNVGICESDFVVIMNALQSNCYLRKFTHVEITELDLAPTVHVSQDSVHASLASSIASMLEHNRTLEVLDIIFFNSTVLFSKPIAQALCMNPTLKILKFLDFTLSCFRSRNNEDVTAFVDMLTKNKSLQILHLKSTSCTEEFYVSLMKGLAVNKTLQELGLYGHNATCTVISCPEYVTNRYRIRFLPD